MNTTCWTTTSSAHCGLGKRRRVKIGFVVPRVELLYEPLSTLLDQILAVDDLGLELAPPVEVVAVAAFQVLESFDERELLLVYDRLARLVHELAHGCALTTLALDLNSRLIDVRLSLVYLMRQVSVLQPFAS